MGVVAGQLEVICGCMFSGKSEELMRRARRAQIAGKKVVLAKLAVDTRYDKDAVASHNGNKWDAIIVETAADLRIKALGYDVVGIDEAQFFAEEDLASLRAMAERQVVIISGLDMTYRGEPFGIMPFLMAIADRVDKLDAICHTCGELATMTQRLIDGKPAPFNGPTVQIGGLETYEARCKRHFYAA